MVIDLVDMGTVPYGYALKMLEELTRKRLCGEIGDTVVLLEHPPVVTLGAQGSDANLILPKRELEKRGIACFRTNRGGEATYHGPGQLVVYPILDLHGFGKDAHRYVRSLEEVGILTAASVGLAASRVEGKPGVWVGEKKVASIGVALKRWVTSHGMAINVAPDLSHFGVITPCGLPSSTISSFSALLGRSVSVQDVMLPLLGALERVFGATLRVAGLPAPGLPLPPWIRVRASDPERMERTRTLLETSRLDTVCREAECPNAAECFSRGVATFLILGNRCTRNCSFCAVESGPPGPPDADEPRRVAEAAKALGLKHVVVTSVTRDDLPDGGAAHFAATIRAIRAHLPQSAVEVLVPDFRGNLADVETVVAARPQLFAHNVETVPRLYGEARRGAQFARSLEVLRHAKRLRPSLPVKSGIMVGLGEEVDEVRESIRAVRETGCDILTLGQYLAPAGDAHPVRRYVTPSMFSTYEVMARAAGFGSVVSGPLVRSSYAAAV